MDSSSIHDRVPSWSRVGSGSFGTVFVGEDVKLKRHVAVKKDVHHVDELTVIYVRECHALRTVQGSEHIVQFIDVAYGNKGVPYLIMEQGSNDLNREIKMCRVLPRERSLLFFCHILSGLEVLHGMGIVHRDLKPANCILDASKDVVKIADLGASKHLCRGRAHTIEVCTRWYSAPELLLRDEFYDASVDFWSAGCSYYEMRSGAPPFRGTDPYDQLRRIFKVTGVPKCTENAEYPSMLSQYDHRAFPSYTPRSFTRDWLFPKEECDQDEKIFQYLLVVDPEKRNVAEARALAEGSSPRRKRALEEESSFGPIAENCDVEDRCKLIDWMDNCQSSLALKDDRFVLSIAIQILDEVVLSNPAPLSEFRMCGLACLMLASKIVVKDDILIADWLNVAGLFGSKRKVVMWERLAFGCIPSPKMLLCFEVQKTLAKQGRMMNSGVMRRLILMLKLRNYRTREVRMVVEQVIAPKA